MVLIRAAVPADAPFYARIQEEEWDDSMTAVVPKIESRIRTFPEGVLIAEHEGVVVGGMTFILLADYAIQDTRSWEEITDNGWCTTHTDDGRVLFGVDLSVSRRAPRSTAPMMFMAGIELAIRKGAERSVWGGRMPRYHRVADRMSAAEYARAKNSRGRHIDPEIELYSKIPGVEVLGVVPEYFKDWESMNYGVIFTWRNPVYRYPFLRPFRRQIVAGLYGASRRRRLRQRRSP
jgi:hypothetical protein